MKYLPLLLLLLACSAPKHTLIGVMHEDHISGDLIIRQWTVVDWMKYDNKGKGVWYYDEIIESDTVPAIVPKKLRKRL